jgi:hypothetical protein
VTASFTRSYEGGGVVSTCSCGWLRYAETAMQAAAQEADHKTCRQPIKRAGTTTDPGRRTTTWDNREDETWIDRL